MNFTKSFFIWLAIIAIAAGVFDYVNKGKVEATATNLSFSEFLKRVDSDNVASVLIQGPHLEGKFKDGKSFMTYLPSYPALIDTLNKRSVTITAAPIESRMSSIIGIALSWFPMLLFIGIWIFVMRQMSGGTGKAMCFGKSKAKMMGEKLDKVMFADVAGIDEAREELVELVDFLKNPAKFRALGGRIPKGCLLIGSPGTGKTLVARAIAGEAGVPFFTISGSEFVEMFVGVGASRVRDMFAQGKKSAPCIIFIDEIDAVGSRRGRGMMGGHEEREQTLNQLLVEMDGFEVNDSVIIIAATNRPDVLDPALLRPGRFDRQIIVPMPDVKGREEILKVHAKKVVMSPNVDMKVIAKGTPGFTGADLANLINEGALLAARFNKKIVSMHELEEAKDKVMMGPQRRSMMMNPEEKKKTAYHEAGHALVALYTPASDPIHKATVIPRGRSLGLVMRLPESETSKGKDQFEADIAVAMGGRVAEEIIFGHEKVTSGASSDIKMASASARAMVREWGMSDKVGPLFYGDEDQGHFGAQKAYSTKTEDLIDHEVRAIVDAGYQQAKALIIKHKAELHKIATGLLEKETLTGDELREMVHGKEAMEAERALKAAREAATEAAGAEVAKKIAAEKAAREPKLGAAKTGAAAAAKNSTRASAPPKKAAKPAKKS